MTQTDILIWLTSMQNTVMDSIAIVLTFMGNEQFYLLIIPLVYWCMSKKTGIRLIYIFLVSIYVNSFLKVITAISRPVGIEGVHTLFTSSAEVGSHYPNDAFPSGHAQGATTLWGYLAYQVKRPSFWLMAVTLIVFISAARLYTGLHWPVDVIGGIIVAVILLLICVRLETIIPRLPRVIHWLLVIMIPGIFIIVFPEAEGVKYSAALLGVGVGHLLETRYIRMEIADKFSSKAKAYGIGAAGLAAIHIGLKAVLPDLLLADFFRYMLIGLWGFLAAPWLFIRLGLYPSSVTKTPGKPPVSV
jgi:membrane-associated phospholipid phosphatase